ncbi:MAG: zinc-binding alcohol dehydrogenase [Candidatus Latescibacteria bacterium]|nr:zinc-binding alcohol dehydrogenase [Candidatus Latescibacterota bacterium]
MRSIAVTFPSPGKCEVRELDTPPVGSTVGSTNVGVRLTRSAISTGTERYVLLGQRPEVVFPCVPGYQSVGVIEEVGGGVEGRQVGQRVTAGRSHLPQGYNEGCGSAHISPTVYKASWTEIIPDSVSDDAAAFAWLIAVAMQGIGLTSPKPGELVVVVRQGVIGQRAVRLALDRGADVVAIDLDDRRLELSRTGGATQAINASKVDTVTAPKEVKPEGADVVIEVTGNPDVVPTAMKLCAHRARFAFQSWYPGDIAFYYDDAHHNELTPHSPCGWGGGDGLRSELKILETGRVDVLPLISHRESAANDAKLYRLLLESPQEMLEGLIVWDDDE